MKHFLTLLFLVSSFLGNASDLYDVFTHTSYKSVGLTLQKDEIKRDYLTSDFDLYQSKIKDASEEIQKAEEQLKKEIIRIISDEFEYFKLQKELKQKIKKANEMYRLDNKEQDRYYNSSKQLSTTDRLEHVEITLNGVVNGIATYQVVYKMEVMSTGYRDAIETFELRHYYSLDFSNGTIYPPSSLSDEQKEVVQKVATPKLQKLYLLHTDKIELHQVERIRKINTKDFITLKDRIDFSEAIIYPFFCGVIVEFPTLSMSSEIFAHQPFRVFLRGEEIRPLLSAFPLIESTFKGLSLQEKPSSYSSELDDDSLWNYLKYRVHPKEEDLFPNFEEEGKTLKKVVVSNYRMQGDTLSELNNSQVFSFLENGKLEHKFTQNKEGVKSGEKYYFYDEVGHLMYEKFGESQDELSQYFYQNNQLLYREHYFMVEGDYMPHMTQKVEGADEEHYFYKDNYRYVYKIPLINDVHYSNSSFRYRKVEPNFYQTESLTFEVDSTRRLIAIQTRRGGMIDLQTNKKGQPLAVYTDNGRNQHLFEYDEKDRIIAYEYTNNRQVNTKVIYRYYSNSKIALKIEKERKGYPKTVHEYEVEYY